MNVKITQLLADFAQENKILLDDFLEQFKLWKAEGADSHYLFGKDGYFVFPKQLKHVHLVPLLDTESLANWNKNWRYRSRRTSDRFLIYAQDSNRYLLIAILPEPVAHTFVKMDTPESKQAMEIFAKAAEDFIYYDIVTI